MWVREVSLEMRRVQPRGALVLVDGVVGDGILGRGNIGVPLAIVDLGLERRR